MRTKKCSAIALAVTLGVAAAGATTASVAGAAKTRDVVAATTPQGPFTVDMTNREDVRQFFYRAHESGNGVDSGWTGSISGCNPGTVSADFLNATLTRLNYFRAMAGVPSNVTFDPTNNQKAQAAALIFSAQGELSHDPPNNWACWTQDGHDGAASSNIGISVAGPDGIDQFMYDGGANNTDTGHRRNMLYVGTNVEGYGGVPGDQTHSAADALYVLTPSVNPKPTPRDGFWAWPPKGFVPYQTVYPRWSFNLANADFTNATVTMTHNGNNVPVTIQARNGGFGDPAIVWIPNGINDGDSWPKPTSDDPWNVTISGVTVGGNAAGPFTYTSTIIDPSVGDAAHTPSGSTSPVVGQDSAYTVPAIPNASGYQWRTTPLTDSTFSDGAENGTSNWTVVAGSPAYNPVETTTKASGTAAFHLWNPDFSEQSMTLNRTLLANANSQLSFDSEVTQFDHLEARVEVSTDGGTTWGSPPAFDQLGGNESSFSHKTVSLAAYAGQQIKVRFWMRYDFSGQNVCVCEASSWFFDNVALSNIQEVGTPTLGTVGANPSFTFNAASAGTYAIDVRPQFSNPTAFGVFSPTLQVTATGGGTCTTCPAAPTITFINQLAGAVDVGFAPAAGSPSAVAGSSPTTSYTVKASPGGQTVTVPAGSTRALLNVPNGTTQTVSVAATNANGTGSYSASSAPFTPSNTSVNVTTSYNASDNTRLGKNATYFGSTKIQAQKTSVGVIAYIVGIVGVNPATPLAPPVSTGPNSFTTSYTTSEQSALTTVMRKYELSPTEAQYFCVTLVGYLLALGGH